MAKTFEISIPAEMRKLHPTVDGKAEVTYTVTNSKPYPARVRVQVIPKNGAKSEWFQISGDVERDLRASESQQFKIAVLIPLDSPTGIFDFRVDVFSVANPSEDFSEGDTVSVDWKQPVAAPTQPLPKWILPAGIAAGCIALVAGVIFVLTRPPNHPPTSRDTIVSSNDVYTYDFKLEDFPFTDADRDDKLKKVLIETEPSQGQLSFSNKPVTINQEIDVTAGVLTCRIPQSYNGTPVQFMFRVSDGKRQSEQSYTMQVKFTVAAFLGTWTRRDRPSSEGSSIQILRNAEKLTVKWRHVDRVEELSTPIADAEDNILEIQRQLPTDRRILRLEISADGKKLKPIAVSKPAPGVIGLSEPTDYGEYDRQ